MSKGNNLGIPTCVPAGDLLLTSDAYSHVVGEAVRSEVCDFCLRRPGIYAEMMPVATLRRCSRCQVRWLGVQRGGGRRSFAPLVGFLLRIQAKLGKRRRGLRLSYFFHIRLLLTTFSVRPCKATFSSDRTRNYWALKMFIVFRSYTSVSYSKLQCAVYWYT